MTTAWRIYSLQSTLENTIEITRWCLAICQLGGDCCLVGHLYYEGAWILYRTSYIRSVHENGRLLYDDDGNYFRIVGSLTPSTFDEFKQTESEWFGFFLVRLYVAYIIFNFVQYRRKHTVRSHVYRDHRDRTETTITPTTRIFDIFSRFDIHFKT